MEGITTCWLDDYEVIRGIGVIESGKEANTANWRRIFKETPKTYFERISSEITIGKNYPAMTWYNTLTPEEDWKRMYNSLTVMTYKKEFFPNGVYDSINTPVLVVPGDRDMI